MAPAPPPQRLQTDILNVQLRSACGSRPDLVRICCRHIRVERAFAHAVKGLLGDDQRNGSEYTRHHDIAVRNGVGNRCGDIQAQIRSERLGHRDGFKSHKTIS